jgi:spore coat protein U-like protein
MNHSKFFGSRMAAPLLAILALGVASTSALAAPNSASFTVSTSVTNSCGVSATGLAFTYSPTTAASGQSTISVTCTTANADFTVSLDKGTGGGTVTGGRLMKNGTYTLAYNLFTDNGHTIIWGDSSGGTIATGNSITANTAVVLQVYGLMQGSLNAISGTYSDTVTASITY